jgi:hypothetical protein
MGAVVAVMQETVTIPTPDQTYSYTDCTSFVLMRRLGLRINVWREPSHGDTRFRYASSLTEMTPSSTLFDGCDTGFLSRELKPAFFEKRLHQRFDFPFHLCSASLALS